VSREVISYFPEGCKILTEFLGKRRQNMKKKKKVCENTKSLFFKIRGGQMPPPASPPPNDVLVREARTSWSYEESLDIVLIF